MQRTYATRRLFRKRTFIKRIVENQLIDNKWICLLRQARQHKSIPDIHCPIATNYITREAYRFFVADYCATQCERRPELAT
jgi:hypothetical protein